ncbi:helix-turn-helix domain-containing protein [Archangium minus]|uniref:Helix-turn-helix domain-containing protein n=1 Tax=Archangium minus TaxID=83450 RepID=A0ABY9WR48_9BACT|nr:helix-turn-helix domain-containing protein [Archangium violaceum]QRK06702.1 helix-turn-helix domain-containing protein [Archangium violaceum]WNG45267.1 helix-turn-helix domain-containing protein [Archangium minus]
MKDQLPEPARYSVPAACRVFGYSRSTFYDRVQKGLIRLTKDGRRSFVSREELERYLKACEGQS